MAIFIAENSLHSLIEQIIKTKPKKKPKINIATQVVFRGLYIDIIRYYCLDPANQNSKKETRHQYCNQQMYRFWLWSSLLISQFNFQRKIIHSTFMTFCLHSTKTAQSVEFCFVFDEFEILVPTNFSTIGSLCVLLVGFVWK